MIIRYFAPILLITALLFCLNGANCQQDDDESKANPISEGPLAVHLVLPADTDKRINTFSGDGFQHFAYYNKMAQDKGELVVFLPGTFGKGKGSGKFNKRAAKLGFHLVGLAYPDNISISKFSSSPDPDAMAKARLNIITGKVPFEALGVNEANSIENRLVSLIRYLSSNFPDEHWDQFLGKNGQIIWNKIVLSGQSQGGGHAAFMAMKLHKVHKVLMFGAPKDFDRRRNCAAKWLSETSLTPINRFFCFNHSADEHNGCTYAQQMQNYAAMKLTSTFKVIDVDDVKPPYDHSRLFTSHAAQRDPHNAPLHDAAYAEVWKYMLSEPVE